MQGHISCHPHSSINITDQTPLTSLAPISEHHHNPFFKGSRADVCELLAMNKPKEFARNGNHHKHSATYTNCQPKKLEMEGT